MEKHLIIGAGEIGKALKNVLCETYTVAIRDKDDDIDGTFDVLHICYPYSGLFVEYTKMYIEKYKPQLVIIHSTVKVGTTRLCGDICVHSPVRGKHPNLEGGIKTFIKFFGGVTMDNAFKAALIFSSIGIPVQVCDYPETTEMAKLLCTTYYGLNIIFQKEVKKLCDKHNINYHQAYEVLNASYNEGYIRLGMPEYVRPVLKDVKGKIGGHCVIPNCKLLAEQFDFGIAKYILGNNETYEDVGGSTSKS